MPNPFPGMDPYLEGDLWTTVHTDLCAEIARQLSPRLRPKYVALSTRRVVLAPPDENGAAAGRTLSRRWHSLLPRSEFFCRGSGRLGAAYRRGQLAGTDSTCQRRDPRRGRAAPGDVYRSAVPDQQARPRSGGICRRALQIVSGNAHLVEIDLLRAGARFPTAQPLPAVPYFVFVSRAERRVKWKSGRLR